MDDHSKQVLRQTFLNLLRAQKTHDRSKKSQVIQEKLFAMREFKQAKIILFYAAFDGEVDTFEMMTQAQKLGKKITLPRILKDQSQILPTAVSDLENDLDIGPYGIKQPKILNETVFLKDIDLILVPGLAFDKENYRLGRGHGYYDRFLGDLPSSILTCGLAYDFQMLDLLPFEAHDIKLSRVLYN